MATTVNGKTKLDEIVDVPEYFNFTYYATRYNDVLPSSIVNTKQAFAHYLSSAVNRQRVVSPFGVNIVNFKTNKKIKKGENNVDEEQEEVEQKEDTIIVQALAAANIPFIEVDDGEENAESRLFPFPLTIFFSINNEDSHIFERWRVECANVRQGRVSVALLTKKEEKEKRDNYIILQYNHLFDEVWSSNAEDVRIIALQDTDRCVLEIPDLFQKRSLSSWLYHRIKRLLIRYPRGTDLFLTHQIYHLSSLQSTNRKKVAIALHFWNTDQLEEQCHYISCILKARNVIVTQIIVTIAQNTTDKKKQNIEKALTKEMAADSTVSSVLQVVRVENRGLDIGGFLVACGLILSKQDQPDLVLKLHTKSNRVERESMIGGLCGQTAFVEQCVDLFEKIADVGQVGAPGHCIYNTEWVGRNCNEHLDDLCRLLLGETKEEYRRAAFVAGTVFLYRWSALQQLFLKRARPCMLRKLLNDERSVDYHWYRNAAARGVPSVTCLSTPDEAVREFEDVFSSCHHHTENKQKDTDEESESAVNNEITEKRDLGCALSSRELDPADKSASTADPGCILAPIVAKHAPYRTRYRDGMIEHAFERFFGTWLGYLGLRTVSREFQIDVKSTFPRIIHFFRFSFIRQKNEFSFTEYVALWSTYRANTPTTIYLHCDILPDGIWFDRVKAEIPVLLVKLIDSMPRIMKKGKNKEDREFVKTAHQSQAVLRLETLIKQGGVCCSLQTIALRPFWPLCEQFSNAECIVSQTQQIQTEREENEETAQNHSTIISKTNAPFLKNQDDALFLKNPDNNNRQNVVQVDVFQHEHNCDLAKAITVQFSKTTLDAITDHNWLAANQNSLYATIFEKIK